MRLQINSNRYVIYLCSLVVVVNFDRVRICCRKQNISSSSYKRKLKESSTSTKLVVYSPDQTSVLNYIILREERTTFDGNYEVNLNYFKNFFKINANDGFIELISSNANVKALSDFISILLVVKVQDLTLKSSSTECNY